ncbi:MAG: glycosyltransferase [Chthoniobacterales bacterium]
MSERSPTVVASYCATFLKPEMLHIYRQITSLRRVRPVVIAQKREQEVHFPFAPVFVVGKPGTHFLRRFWYRTLRNAPWQVSRGEVEQIEAILGKTEAQLLHIYFGHIAVHLLPLMRHWGKPTVVSFHGADVLVDLDKPRYRAATREMLAAARLVLVRSESLARAVRELGCPETKVRLQRTGIPLSDISFRARTWPNDGAWKFLQGGRLIEKKGFKTSLRAFAAFQKKNPAASFTIAGEGPLLSELQALAGELGIEDRVRFAGFLAQNELREEFYRAHLFLHPSELGADGNQEGVPNAMLEAMASGLPVFATKHGGIPEAIDDGVSGTLVEERDHEGLGAALLAGTERPEALQRWAEAGARSVAEKFEQATQARVFEELYFEAIGASDLRT